MHIIFSLKFDFKIIESASLLLELIVNILKKKINKFIVNIIFIINYQTANVKILKNIVPGLIGEYRYVALIRTWRLLNAQGPPVLLKVDMIEISGNGFCLLAFFLFFFFYGKFCLLAFIPQSRGHFMFLIITKCDFL
jgi:hypothetical protein